MINLLLFILFHLAQAEAEIVKIPLETIRVPIKYAPFYKNENLYRHPLDNHYDLIYVGEVRIARQTFRALFDSGSNDVWFVGSQCDSKFCRGRIAYDVAGLQHSYEERLTLSYGAGKAHGLVVSDDIRLGTLVSKGQNFVAAEYVTISRHYQFDGLIGMGPMKGGYWVKGPTFIENLKRQGILKTPWFSFVLFDQSSGHQSYMCLGGDEPTLYRGDLHWLHNISNHYWMVQITHVGFGHTFGATKGTAVIDSGTSFIMVPPAILAGIHQLTRAVQADENFYSVDCKNYTRLPTITLKINGKLKVPLYPEDYVDVYEGNCYLNFLPMDEDPQLNSPDWMLGASFLRAYYVVFDAAENRIGLARYKHK